MNDYPTEIEQASVDLWLSQGAIKVESYGEENTYYVDQFDQHFYCKNYPPYAPMRFYNDK